MSQAFKRERVNGQLFYTSLEFDPTFLFVERLAADKWVPTVRRKTSYEDPGVEVSGPPFRNQRAAERWARENGKR